MKRKFVITIGILLMVMLSMAIGLVACDKSYITDEASQCDKLPASGVDCATSALYFEEFRGQNNVEIGPVKHVIETLDEETTFANISKVEALNIIESLGYTLEDTKVSLIRDNGADRICWEILTGKILFEIDTTTGEVLSISDNTEYESKSPTVDAENAVEIALQKLVAINELPTEIGKPVLELKESKWGTIHRIYWQQDINGVPVKNGYISLELDTSGRIRHFRKFWQDFEMNTLPNLTNDEAIKIAQENIITKELPISLKKRMGKAENLYAYLIIEKPFNSLDESKPILGEYCLVWKVVFESGSGGSYENVLLSVNANSGELEGIDFTK